MKHVLICCLSSLIIPKSIATPPEHVTKDDIVAPFELMICPFPGLTPGTTNSFPEHRIAIFGTFRTQTSLTPDAIAKATSREES